MCKVKNMLECITASSKNGKFTRNNIIQEEIKGTWNFYILRKK